MKSPALLSQQHHQSTTLSKVMNEYMLLFHYEALPEGFVPSAEMIQEMNAQWGQWIGDIAANGKFISTGRLNDGGKVVRQSGVTDGPYVEIKEIVGGFLFLKADSIEEAQELGAGCPVLNSGGALEIRELAPRSLM
jgi:hypothetical protein